MSENIHIYTNTKAGVDTNVWFTMLIMLIVSSGILAFRVATAPKKVVFEVSQSSSNAIGPLKYSTDTPVALTAATSDKNKVSWNFGDGTPSEGGLTVKHKFSTPGIYHVNASVNGFPSKNELVDTIVANLPIPAPAVVPAENIIDGPTSFAVKDQKNFTCKQKAASYEWKVENDPEHPRPQTGDVATFVFATPGTKTIVLTTKNPDNVSKLVVNVTGTTAPAQQTTKPKKHKHTQGKPDDWNLE